MDYHILRAFADSWALIALMVVFLGAVAWAWRPGSRKTHEDTANIPFRHEDKPACADGHPGGRSDDGATL
jgi:cytochrome c oxidase cbb3-type subunit 4